MKKIVFILSIILLPIISFGQNDKLDKDQIAVQKQAEKLRVAMIDADEMQLKALTSDKLSYGHSGGHIENQEEFVAKIVSGKSDFVTINLQDETISIVDKTAIVRHKFFAHTKDGGIEKDIQLGILLIWQKQKKNWLLIARQAYKLPTNENNKK